MTAKCLSNLKIYCQNEQDQSNIFDFIYFEYRNSVTICTWEPDPVDTGTWGMFVDDFPMELWDKLVEYNYFTPDELQLLTKVNGLSMKTLNDAISVRYGYKDWEQMKGED